MIAVLALAASGCGGGGGGGGGGGDVDACGGATKGCAIGTIVDSQTGAGVGNVAVSSGGTLAAMVTKAVGTNLATTNSQGWFSATGIEQADAVVFCFQAAGYVTKCHSFTIEGTKTLNMPPIKLQQAGAALTLNAGAGGTITDATTGAEMTVGAGAVCASDRTTAYTGTATCYLTPIDSIESAPGEFTGIRNDASTVAIQTTGMMDITCKDGSGNMLNLCGGDGATANVKIPVFGFGDCATLPATIESWDFDPTTGKWNEFGTFTKTCGATTQTSYYSGLVHHWSWWNADTPQDLTCLRGFVYAGATTNPNELATVTCDLSEGAGQTIRLTRSIQTASDGSFCIEVARGSYYSCIAKKGQFVSNVISGTATTTQLACSPDSSVCADIGTFALTDPVFQTTLTWGAESTAVPSDLDSHFISADGSTQVYYADKNQTVDVNKGSLTTTPYIELDTDDTTWEGPEHITVVPGVAAGTYRFCVHNFAGDGDLTTSQAQVIAAGPSANLPRIYTVPTSPAGQTVWQVFEVAIGSGDSLTFTDLDRLVSGDDAKTACLQ